MACAGETGISTDNPNAVANGDEPQPPNDYETFREKIAELTLSVDASSQVAAQAKVDQAARLRRCRSITSLWPRGTEVELGSEGGRFPGDRKRIRASGKVF